MQVSDIRIEIVPIRADVGVEFLEALTAGVMCWTGEIDIVAL